MDIVTTVAGPSTRAARAYGMCSGRGNGTGRELGAAGVWSGPVASGVTPHERLSQRPRPVIVLDPQRASAPPRWSP